MTPASEKPTSICIIGMHRSGTSAITRGFNLLGAYLGEDEDLMPPLPENPEGFWERMDIYYLQDRILSALGTDWSTCRPLPENWHVTPEIHPLKKELTQLVVNNFSGKQLWLWKDPRTCLLLPLWKDVLEELGIDIKVVFVIRNPFDVARSLEKRNGFPLHKGMAMWFTYSLTALKGIENLDTVFVSYDNFLADWSTKLKYCAEALGVRWPDNDSLLKTQMASFVRHDLRHSVSGVDELKAVNIPTPIIYLYKHLLELEFGKKTANMSDGYLTDGMYNEFLNYAMMFDCNMARLPDSQLMSKRSFISRFSKHIKSLIFKAMLY